MNTIIADRPPYQLEMDAERTVAGNYIVTLASPEGALGLYLDDESLSRLIGALRDAAASPIQQNNPKQLLRGVDENGCARN